MLSHGETSGLPSAHAREELQSATTNGAFIAVDYFKHWKAAYDTAQRLLRDEDAAADAIQRVFLRLVVAANAGLTTQRDRSYFVTAARHEAISILRETRRRHALFVRTESSIGWARNKRLRTRSGGLCSK
jgi:hypothetical protein